LAIEEQKGLLALGAASLFILGGPFGGFDSKQVFLFCISSPLSPYFTTARGNPSLLERVQASGHRRRNFGGPRHFFAD